MPQSSQNPSSPQKSVESSALLTPDAVQTSDTRGWIRGIVFVALFAALFIGASFVKSAPGASIPFSLQSFAIMLAGGLLGAAYGFWSIFLVVALTAIGIPVMNGPGGLAQIFGPTGGFIWMFSVSALLIGWSCDRLYKHNPNRRSLLRLLQLMLIMIVFGVLLLYVTGVPWLAYVSETLDLAGAFKVGMLPFLPFDFIKAIAAAFVVDAIRPYIAKIRPARTRQ